jgi:hypothetical protein
MNDSYITRQLAVQVFFQAHGIGGTGVQRGIFCSVYLLSSSHVRDRLYDNFYTQSEAR